MMNYMIILFSEGSLVSLPCFQKLGGVMGKIFWEKKCLGQKMEPYMLSQGQKYGSRHKYGHRHRHFLPPRWFWLNFFSWTSKYRSLNITHKQNRYISICLRHLKLTLNLFNPLLTRFCKMAVAWWWTLLCCKTYVSW